MAEALQRRVWDRVAAEIAGGHLVCDRCGRQVHASEERVRVWVEHGWPMCHERTMRRVGRHGNVLPPVEERA